MPFRRFLPFLFLVLFLNFAAPVHAAAPPINAEGAAKLKATFEKILTYQKNAVDPAGKVKLEYDGDVMVEQAGTYYAVTLPHARITYPDGSHLDIGMISVNASPHDVPGQWKMAVAIPTPIILMDAKQTQAIKVDIGAQKAAGIWDENLENFAKLDAEYKNITVSNPASGFTMQLPEMKILYDFASGNDGRWSGPGHFVARNLVAGVNGQGIKVADINADFGIEGYNPAILKDYRAFLKTFMDEKSKEAPGTPPDSAKTTQLADKLMQLILNSSNGLKADYRVSGVELTRTAPGGTPEAVKIDKAFFGMDMNGFQNDKVSLGLKLGYDGFGINPPPPGYEGVLPSTSNIDVAFHNIPARQIAELAKNTLESSIQQPALAQMAGLSLLMKAPAILSQAGTYMDIKNNYIGNDDYRFEINGQAKADINAVTNATADIKGSFRGLDGLLAKVKAIATDLKNPGAPNAQAMSRTLETLKTYGKAQPGPDGQPVYMYDFTLDAKGQMLLNGKPAGLGGMPAVPPGAAAP